MTPRALATASFIVWALTACAGDDASGEPACLDPLPACDNPTVPPTYDRLFDFVFSSCGSAATGPSCHSDEGRQLGLLLADPDSAYDHLLGDADGRARVVPGSPECSELVRRIESDDPDFQMPPRAPLSEGLRCSIRMWIEAGAERDP